MAAGSSSLRTLRRRVGAAFLAALGLTLLLALAVHPSTTGNWEVLAAAGLLAWIFLALWFGLLTPWLTSGSHARLIVAPLIPLVIWEVALATDDLTNWFPVLMAAVTTVGAMLVSEFWRLWVFWKPEHPMSGGFAGLVLTGLAIVMMTAMFAAASGFLYAHGALSKAKLPDAPFMKLQEDYFWHFFDAVPALKVPQTLNWAEPVKFTDPVSGMLLLAYKVLVILPVVGYIAWLVKEHRQRTAAAGAAR
ncbi:MAG TPA: hypothetical protein VH418_17745 [Solirubrobacteraceae bacterium]|jgi:hypothetical protein